MRTILTLSIVAALGLAACQPATPPADQSAAAPAPAAAQAPLADPVQEFQTALAQVIASPHRSEANRARDLYRSPMQTLGFFGLGPGQTVIEITPGGGWYTEILAPVLRDKGSYVAAVIDPESAASERARDYYTRSNQEFADKLAAAPGLYDQARVHAFSLAEPNFGEDGSADLVLTFRNVHNWVGQDALAGMFAGFFRVLKPGGVLGVVEHRAHPEDPRDLKELAQTGYFPEAVVIEAAQQAGFELADSSEINANPADTKDHPNNVWNLPPSLRVKEGDDPEKYQAIGESDRMTLKFVKPAG